MIVTKNEKIIKLIFGNYIYILVIKLNTDR